ncbi:MAG: hypothetical protein PHV77_05965 [Candidatus Omnitrophica bacterium]|nr:hypothetical protein [Candidatus Omnitrophota bacterium]
MNVRTKYDNTTAFTLVEVMASVLVLGIGLVLVANSYMLALKASNSASNNIQALYLAQSKMDALEITDLEEAGFSPCQYNEVLQYAGRDYDYNIAITKDAGSLTLSKYYVGACLTVGWEEQGSARKAVLTSFFQKKEEDEESEEREL